jgi:TPP-dependent pyruvate/acetoin dehydrogenase alpha subunit
MHIGDMHQGIVPMISMLGESLPVACGIALTMKMRKHSTIVLAACGDGATSTGAFHEAMNFASVQKLPLVLVIENNGYAYSTPTSKQFAVKNLSERALAYGIPGQSVDGNDVLAVIEAVEHAVEHARNGAGPAIVECRTFRVRGHSEADKADYVSEELRKEWGARDPIERFKVCLIQQNILTATVANEIATKIKAVVDDAVNFAEHSPAPDVSTVAEYVFAPDGPIAIIGEANASKPNYVNALDQRTGQPFNTINKVEEVVGRR